MIHSLRPRSILRSLKPSPSSSPVTPKWVSTTTTQNPLQHPLNPLAHLPSFINGAREAKQLSEYTLAVVSALKSCSSARDISLGEQIHGLVLKSGLGSTIFVQNSLINLYAKCGLIKAARLMFDACLVLDTVSCNIILAAYVKIGDLDESCKLFEVIPNKGCVSYTTMVMGFAQNGYWVEAAEVFRTMRRCGVVPNEVTMVSVISAYLHLGALLDAQALHALVAKLGLEDFVHVSTNLLHMYSLCSSTKDARVLFDEMPEPNIVSWNVMLNGYSKAGQVDLARDVFERIPMKDVVSWGTMVDGYVRVGRLREALYMYQVMTQSGLGPNEVMIVDLVSACGGMMAVLEGEQFHSIIVRRGFDCYDFIQSTIIHFYASCSKINLALLQFELGSKDHVPSWNALISGSIRNGMIEQARKLFDEMPERDVFSWSAIISGYAQGEQPGITLDLFHRMVASGIRPNEVTMVSVLSAIATLGSLKEGVWAHEYIHYNNIPLNDNLGAALVDMYAKCGSINRAMELFYQIRENVSSVSPWNAIICGLAMHGHADMSLKIFSELEKVQMKLNSITFIGVLTACCHAGLVEAGKNYFRSMRSLYNVEPNIKHYGCMVDLLGRAGRLEEAEELIKSMPMKADVVIWGTLLAASRKHGEVEIGERAADCLGRLDTCHGPSKVLLSSIYADAGRWQDAFSVREVMRSQSMPRSPGCSEIT